MHFTLMAMMLVLMLALALASLIPGTDPKDNGIKKARKDVSAAEHEQAAEELTWHRQKVHSLLCTVLSMRGGSFCCPHHALVRESELV